MKPKDPFQQLGRFIASGWAGFRRLDPKVQWGVLAVLTALLLIPLTGMLGGADTPDPTATPIAASTTTPVEPSAPSTMLPDEPSAAATPASVEPSATPTRASAAPKVIALTVDEIAEKINSADMGGMKVGDQYRLTGALVGSDYWGTGASGDFFVTLETKVGSDLIVFVAESDADEWEDGTRVEMVVEDVERTINGETSHGWLEAKSVKTTSGGTN